MQSWKTSDWFLSRSFSHGRRQWSLEKLVVRIYQVAPGSSSLAILTVPRTSRGAETFLPIANVSHGNPNRVSRTFARHVVALSSNGKLEFELAPGQLLCHLPEEELSTGIEYMERLKKKKKRKKEIMRFVKVRVFESFVLSFLVSFLN